MLQGGEIIIILIVALLVFGPTRLPDLANKLGRWTAELRTAARDIRRGLEAEVSDLKGPIDELKQTTADLKRQVDEAGVSRLDWTGPKPVSGPTPEEAMADLDEIERAPGDEGER